MDELNLNISLHSILAQELLKGKYHGVFDIFC